MNHNDFLIRCDPRGASLRLQRITVRAIGPATRQVGNGHVHLSWDCPRVRTLRNLVKSTLGCTPWLAGLCRRRARLSLRRLDGGPYEWQL